MLGDVLDAVAGAVDVAILVTDAEGRVELWNDGAERLFGWSAVEAIGNVARDLIVPVSEQELSLRIRSSLPELGEWQGTFRCRRRDGSELPVKVVDIPVYAEDDSMVAIVCVASDLSAHLAAARGSSELRAIADASTDAILSVAGDRIASWSAAAQRLLGWTADEAIGMDIWNLVPDDLIDSGHTILESVRAGECVESLETERLTRNGTRIPVALDVTPVFDEIEQRWIGVVTMRDRRTRDEVIEAAVVAEAQYRALMAESTEIVIVVDAEGRLKAVSSSAERILGFTPAELVGEQATVLVHPDDLGRAGAAIQRSIDHPNERPQVTYRRRTADGAWRWAEATLTNRLDDVVIAGIVVNVTDVDAREAARAQLVRREAQYRSLFEHAADVAVIVAPDGTIVEATPSSTKALGRSPAELVGADIGDALGPEFRALLARNRLAGDRDLLTLVLDRSDAEEAMWVDVEVRNLVADPAVAGFVLNLRDVTDRMTATGALKASESRLSAVVNRSSDVAMFFEEDGTIHWVSPAISEVFGIEPEALVGSCGFDLIHPDDRERVLGEFLDGLRSTGDHVVVEFRTPDFGSGVRWVEEVATDLLDDPDVGYVVANLRDITDRRTAHEELARLALVDELTALPNRNALLDLIGAGLDSKADDAICAVIFFDVDDFCDVNDALGHTVGDALLVGIARRVEAALPDGAHLARFGGDQFAVFCADAGDLPRCLAIANTVQAALDAPFFIDGNEVFAVVSLGIALSPPDDVDALLRRADTALYRAKKAGRGQIVLFERELATESMQRLHYAGELRRGLERREIVPYYQPVVDLATGKVVAVEALARWHHPEYGLVPPDVFVPVAESTGLIGELGHQVLRQSCNDAVEWLSRGRRLQVAVNASAVQLMDLAFPDQVAAALAEAGLPADQLTIEVTETAALRDMAIALQTLTALRDQGIAVSLDDFGTGYSSLSLLKRLPVSALKIDRSFVAGLGRSDDDDRIVTGVVSLALALHFHVVAEGIETADQAQRLGGLGAQFGQGYLWSPAVPAADLLSTIERIEAMDVTTWSAGTD